jgi:hypothetical protein
LGSVHPGALARPRCLLCNATFVALQGARQHIRKGVCCKDPRVMTPPVAEVAYHAQFLLPQPRMFTTSLACPGCTHAFAALAHLDQHLCGGGCAQLPSIAVRQWAPPEPPVDPRSQYA